MTPIFLAIDPGASGGIALIHDDMISCWPMPETEYDISDFLRSISPPQRTIAAVEKVGGTVGGGPVCPVCKQARNRSPGSAMFNFGSNYGAVRMALVSLGLKPHTRCTPGNLLSLPPQRWQRGLGIDQKRKGESATKWKNRLKWNAQQLYPDLHITLDTADAVLVVTYLKRLYEGDVS